VIRELTAELLVNSERSENAVHEIILQGNVYKKLADFKFLFNKYTLRAYPDIVMIVNGFKNNFLKGQVEANLEKGIKSGLYRSEIDIKQTAMIYLQMIFMCFCGSTCAIETILAANNLYLNGIISPSARTMVAQLDNQ
jgi:hypothetical protein